MMDEKNRSDEDSNGDSETEDKLEILLKELMNNSDSLVSIIPVLEKLKKAGIIDLINSISRDYMPTDIEFFGHMFSSREFTYAALKSANVLLSVMYAMADEKISDTIKNLMFNLRGAMDAASSAAKTTSSLGTLELYRMLKDPEIAAGIRAVMAIMKAVGEVLKKAEG
ncbi:MAG: DUF1641 domain-containing protein [Thermoplasmata archaeon]